MHRAGPSPLWVVLVLASGIWNVGCGGEDSPAVIRSDSATTITADAPDPSQIGQAVSVSWTVLPVPPATGTPTGTVTVSDGTGATCAAAVAAGTCSVTPTTGGSKTLSALYSGDSSFDASQDTEPHIVLFGTVVLVPSDPTPGPDTVSFQPGAVNGNEVTIRVVATDVDDFFGAAFRVNYAPVYLEFVSFDSAGSFLRDGGVTPQFSVNATAVPGSVLVAATRVDAATFSGVDVSGSRDLLTVTFRVRATPPVSGTPITFGDPKEVRDSVQPPPQGNLIPISWLDASLQAR